MAIDLTLDPDIDNAPQINAATATPGALVTLPTDREYPVGAPIVVNGSSLTARGPGVARLRVMRDAIPSEGFGAGARFKSDKRQHVKLLGLDALVERIHVTGRNVPKGRATVITDPVATADEPQYNPNLEFEHAFLLGGKHPQLLGCGGHYVWGDGWCITGSAEDAFIQDFETLGVGRQSGAITMHSGKGVIDGHKVLGPTRRCGIDFEPLHGRTVSGIIIRNFKLDLTRLIALSFGGGGDPLGGTNGNRIFDILIEDGVIGPKGLNIWNEAIGANKWSNIRVRRISVPNGGGGTPVVAAGVEGLVLLDIGMVNLARKPKDIPAIKIEKCTGLVVQRNSARYWPVCVAVSESTGIVGAPMGHPDANTHFWDVRANGHAYGPEYDPVNRPGVRDDLGLIPERPEPILEAAVPVSTPTPDPMPVPPPEPPAPEPTPEPTPEPEPLPETVTVNKTEWEKAQQVILAAHRYEAAEIAKQQAKAGLTAAEVEAQKAQLELFGLVD